MKGNLASRNRQMRLAHATRHTVASRPSNGASLAMCANQRTGGARGTDRASVDALLFESRSHFIAVAHRILGNREDAEDAVHDALISAYHGLPRFQGRSAPRTWFTRIVVNSALMIRRCQRRFLSLDELPTYQPEPESIAAENETFRLLDQLYFN